MTSNSTIRILDGLKKNSKNDKNLRIFLEIILSEEIKGRYFWRDYYHKELENSLKGWEANYED